MTPVCGLRWMVCGRKERDGANYDQIADILVAGLSQAGQQLSEWYVLEGRKSYMSGLKCDRD